VFGKHYADGELTLFISCTYALFSSVLGRGPFSAAVVAVRARQATSEVEKNAERNRIERIAATLGPSPPLPPIGLKVAEFAPASERQKHLKDTLSR
jgi:hypothetical protein